MLTSTDLSQMGLSALVDHIVDTHHAYLRCVLPQLAAQAERLAQTHGQEKPELTELLTILRGFAEDIHLHMQKEERMLFPAIVNLERGEFGAPLARMIEVMESEHEAAERDLASMRKLTQNYSTQAGCCTTYEALMKGLSELESDMERHVHAENDILFPRTLAHS